MITVASIVFLLAFVVLGARPYRVSEALPPSEEVTAMPATVYTGGLLQGNVIIENTNSARVPLDESDGYFALALRREAQQHRDQRTETEERIAQQRQKLAKLKEKLGRLKPNPSCFICKNTLIKPYPDRDYYCDQCKSFVSVNAPR